MDAGPAHGGDVVAAVDAAFGHDHPIVRSGHPLEQLEGGLEPGLEGLQVAVVDADQRRLETERQVQLGRVVHLDQHVQAELACPPVEPARSAALSAATMSSRQSAPSARVSHT
jgi:hypothetical protein